MKNGVPWDVATTLDEAERAAMVITFAEMGGSRFDWSTGTWQQPDA